MNIVNSYLNIADYFSGDTIKINSSRCLNSRFRQINCTICADACPVENTLTLEKGNHTIDHETCVHCGLCLHICPTEVFVRPDPTLKRLPKTTRTLNTSSVSLICQQNSNPQNAATPIVIQTKRCLAALSSSDLLALAQENTEIILDDSHCVDCPIGQVQPYIEQTVERANAWAAILSDHAPIALQTQLPPETEMHRCVVVDIDRPPMSRRGFFQSITQFGKESIDAARADDDIDAAVLGRFVPVAERLSHFVPKQRTKLLSILDSQVSVDETTAEEPLTHDAHSKLPLLDVVMDAEKCTACGLCSRFCPTDALTFASDEEYFVLAFYPALCLGDDCNICFHACPEDAIVLEKVLPTANVLSKKPRYLVAGELRQCEKCGQPIANGEGLPSTCFVCRPRPNMAFKLP